MPTAPASGSAPLIVHGIVLPPPSAGTASGSGNGPASTVSWPSVAITAIVVTCVVLGKSTEATVAGVVLIVLLSHQCPDLAGLRLLTSRTTAGQEGDR